MTDYFDHRPSHHEQEYSHHTLSYAGDPIDENGLRRTATQESHHSHASASTRSWVYNQMNPPPPPPRESAPASVLTPFHGPRPLPEPSYHHSIHQQQFQQQQLHQQPHPLFRRPIQYADTLEEDEADDYMPPDTRMMGMVQGYHHSPGFAPAMAGPSTLGAMAPSTPGVDEGGPSYPHHHENGNRSFVGGFLSGLKRIPRMFRGGSSRDKKGLGRQGALPNGSSTTMTGFTGGNTLPRYLSNPSIGPSNPQFAHRMSLAVANGSIPPDSSPTAFQIRDHPELRDHPGAQYPALTVTPPSDGIQEEQADFYDNDDMPPNDRPQFPEPSLAEPHSTPMGRATVMVYGTESQAPTITQVPPSSFIQQQQHQPNPAPGPRVSYQADLPTRANAQAQTSPPPSTSPIGSPVQRRRATPGPTSHYRQAPPTDVLSASIGPTSRYTGTTATSYYDPSFSSQLSPVEKFFKGFYHLPWVAQQRVTVDYRPGESPRAKGKMKSLKKPKTSWYQSVMNRTSRDVDLLSGSNTVTSARTSNVLSSLGSPISRRSGRSSSANRHHASSNPTRHHRSRRRRNTTSTNNTDAHRSASPIVPTVYPYTVPPYPPYTYPYMPYPPTMPMPQYAQAAGQTSPRGPRARSHHHRAAQKYPQGGYAPFQPMTMPQHAPPMPMPPPGAPMYYIAPSPPQSQNGENGAAAPGGHMQQFSPVLVQYVPGSFPQDRHATTTMVSPPTTPERPTARSS